MTFDELRNKYSSISFDLYEYIEDEKNINLYFYYSMGDLHFKHTLIITKKDFFVMENATEKDVFLFNLGVMEIINYYKLACPKKIILKAGALRDEQKSFFRKLFYKGLGEFRYINDIEIDEENFVTFENYANNFLVKSKKNNFSGNVIPVGGGKDSIVTLELLKEEKDKNICLIVNPRGATIDTVDVAGYGLDNTIEVLRKLDPQLLELNKKGYLNGHVPFSAMLAFLSIFCALLTNKENVILSNESSADECTDEVSGANHQYSKSMEFEKDFVSYVEKYITPGIHYFSLLRGMREIDIAKLFSKHKKYHKIFRSCNVGSKNGGNSWCGECSKCLFVYIILSPFLTEEELNNIFGKNLLDDINLLKYFRELTGVDSVKPFECVGTRDEVNEAVNLTIQKYNGKKIPILLEEYIKLNNK